MEVRENAKHSLRIVAAGRQFFLSREENMIIFENVSKFIISNVTLHIPEGKTVGLIGASGAGKTTLIKLACGLLQAESGQVFAMRRKPSLRRRDWGKDLSVLFADKPFLQKEDTVAENLGMLKHIYRLPEDEFCKDYKTLSERLGFDAIAGQSVKNLSLGQRRRVEIAAALISRPKLLLLDESTIGLDADAKQTFYELIIEKEREGMTVLVTSHNMEEISKLCSRIALLDKGKLLYYGSETQIRRQFAPMDTLELKLLDGFPDLEDLPLKSYKVDGDILKITYNSNYITSAEILKLILAQTKIAEMKIHKPDMTDIILQMRKIKGTMTAEREK